MSVSGDGAKPAFQVDVEADKAKAGPDAPRNRRVATQAASLGHTADEVLHQRRSLPYCPARMAVGGFLAIAVLGYFTLFAKSKPGTSPGDVAKVACGDGEPSK